MERVGKVSKGALISGVIFAALTLFFTYFAAGLVSSGGGGDPAGTAIGNGIAWLAVLLLYLFTGTFALIALIGGDMPAVGRIAYALLSLCAAFAISMALWDMFAAYSSNVSGSSGRRNS